MRGFQVFVDESGQRSASPKSSDHFVMSAVMIHECNLVSVQEAQAELRRTLGREKNHPLHWVNLKGHSLRVVAAQSLAAMPVNVISVVVCKRHLTKALPHESVAYLFTLRLLLERVSWFTQTRDAPVRYTLSAITRFKLAQLREYEAKLRHDPQCPIAWDRLSPGRIDQPTRIEQLQLADIAASATAQAFEPDRYQITERRYLECLKPVLWYGKDGASLPSYGLKMHPWNDATQGLYPWVAEL